MSCQNNMQFCLSPKVYKYNSGFNKLVFFSNRLRWIPQSGDSHSPSRKFTRPSQKFFRYSYKRKRRAKKLSNFAITQPNLLVLHSRVCNNINIQLLSFLVMVTREAFQMVFMILIWFYLFQFLYSCCCQQISHLGQKKPISVENLIYSNIDSCFVS